MRRNVVLFLWAGPRVVARLGPEHPDPEQVELDAIADAYVAANDGVRPVVRVLEVAQVGRSRGVGRDHGPAGTLPWVA